MARQKAEIPVEKIKEEILGKHYELSVVFVSYERIKSLNQKYRKKNEATDVLSFSLSDKMGEIFICKAMAKIKSAKFGETYENYLLFIVIHGILHLKGLSHGDKMEKYEQRYYSRYRHRYL